MTTIGQKIEEYIDYLGYTYDEVSSATKISNQDLLLVFKDEREVSPQELKSFAILFNVPQEELTNGIALDEVANFPHLTTVQGITQDGMTDNDYKELQKFDQYLKKSFKNK